jgi:hypothetical protein
MKDAVAGGSLNSGQSCALEITKFSTTLLYESKTDNSWLMKETFPNWRVPTLIVFTVRR